MEILLLEDVNGIGKKNDILVVGDGFALNCLLPQRKALVATPTVRKRYAEQIKRRAEEKETEKQVQTQAAAVLAGKGITIAHKATKAGKLYAGVTAKNIVDALKEQHTLQISEDAVMLDEPIKALGTSDVKIKLGNQEQSVKVTVEAAK